MANFGSLLWRQSHSPNSNNCNLHYLTWRSPGAYHNKVGSLSPVEHLVGFELGTFRFLLQCLNPIGHSCSLSLLSPFIDVYKNVYVSSFFLCTVRLWSSLPIEYFPLTYDLNGFKCRINRRPLTVGSFETDFLYALILLYFFSCNSMSFSDCSALHWVNPN